MNSGSQSSAPPSISAPATSSATPAKSSAAPPVSSSAKPAASSSSPVIATPACGSAGGTCSAAQVATHNSAGNCWVIYNAGYYNVTSYVNAHPGGSAVFNSTTCGKDITTYLNGTSSTAGAKHKHSASAYSALNSYYIGKVQ